MRFAFRLIKWLFMKGLKLIFFILLANNLIAETILDDSLIFENTKVVVVNDMGFPCSEFESAKEDILDKYIQESKKKVVLFLGLNYTSILSSRLGWIDWLDSELFNLSFRGRNEFFVYIMNQVINEKVVLVGGLGITNIIYDINNYLKFNNPQIKLIPKNAVRMDTILDTLTFVPPDNWDQIELFNNQIKMESKFDILFKTMIEMLSEVKMNGGKAEFSVITKYNYIYYKRILDFYSDENFMFIKRVENTFDTTDQNYDFTELISQYKNDTKYFYIGGTKGKMKINYGFVKKKKFKFKSNVKDSTNQNQLDLIYFDYDDEMKYIPESNYDYLYLFDDIGERDERKIMTNWW